MTEEELKKLDKDLEEEENKIRSQLGEIADKDPAIKDGGDYKVRVPDYGDDTDEDAYTHEVTDLDRNMALKSELEIKLKDIIKTREKIKKGRYGKCENCSQDIQAERLKVIPIASLCVDCAKK